MNKSKARRDRIMEIVTEDGVSANFINSQTGMSNILIAYSLVTLLREGKVEVERVETAQGSQLRWRLSKVHRLQNSPLDPGLVNSAKMAP